MAGRRAQHLFGGRPSDTLTPQLIAQQGQSIGQGIASLFGGAAAGVREGRQRRDTDRREKARLAVAERDSQRRASTRQAELTSLERRAQMRQDGMMDRLRAGAEVNELKNMASEATTQARELESLRQFQAQFPEGQAPEELSQRIRDLEGGAGGLMQEVQRRAQAGGLSPADLQDSPEGLVTQGHALDAEIKDAEIQLGEAKKLKGRARFLAMRSSRDRLMDLRKRRGRIGERAGHLQQAAADSAERQEAAKAETMRVRKARRFVEEQLKLRGMATKDLTESEREAVYSAVMAGDTKGALSLVKEAISMRDKPKAEGQMTPEERLAGARQRGREQAETVRGKAERVGEIVGEQAVNDTMNSVFGLFGGVPSGQGGATQPAPTEDAKPEAESFDASSDAEQTEFVKRAVPDPDQAAQVLAFIEREQARMGRRFNERHIAKLIEVMTGAR